MKIFLVVTFVIFYILTALGFYDAAKFNFKYGDWQKYIATALWPIAVGLEFTVKGFKFVLSKLTN